MDIINQLDSVWRDVGCCSEHINKFTEIHA